MPTAINDFNDPDTSDDNDDDDDDEEEKRLNKELGKLQMELLLLTKTG